MTAADCEREFKPQVGQTGKNVIWVPTPDAQVDAMLSLARVGPQDVVYDLGAGDGKIAIAAGKLGAQAVGVEFNPDMVKLAQCLVSAEDVADRTRIVQGDIFKENFDRATVVTMYLLPELNLCLRHRSARYETWNTRRVAPVLDGRLAARRALGLWDRTSGSSRRVWPARGRCRRTRSVTVQLEQQFQKISGSVVDPVKPSPARGAPSCEAIGWNSISGTTAA